jgi:hypothetical protein
MDKVQKPNSPESSSLVFLDGPQSFTFFLEDVDKAIKLHLPGHMKYASHFIFSGQETLYIIHTFSQHVLTAIASVACSV